MLITEFASMTEFKNSKRNHSSSFFVLKCKTIFSPYVYRYIPLNNCLFYQKKKFDFFKNLYLVFLKLSLTSCRKYFMHFQDVVFRTDLTHEKKIKFSEESCLKIKQFYQSNKFWG